MGATFSEFRLIAQNFFFWASTHRNPVHCENWPHESYLLASTAYLLTR